MKQAILNLILFLMMTTHPFAAEKVDPELIIKKMFTEDVNRVDRFFTQAFLNQVPKKKLIEIITFYKIKLGMFKKAVAIGTGQKYTLHFERGTTVCTIYIDDKSKITGIWFAGIFFKNDSLKKILVKATSIPGDISITLIKNNKELLISLASDKAMSSASSAKLYILKKLTAQVKSGKNKWEDTLKLEDKYKSLPTGILQTWPAGSELTLRTLANLMISKSDNTASDHLLFFLGRVNVEAISPKRIKPFISTGELFKLKWGLNKKDRDAYIKAPLKEKRKMLKALESMKRTAIRFENKNVAVKEIEWLISTGELCQTIYELRNNSSIAINPGLAEKSNWHLVGFKGGSEPGVLQYTHVLKKTKDGDIFALSATLNHPSQQVDHKNFSALIQRIISLIHSGKLDQ
ncbi:MAG: serine hydrolase [Lentisphaeria bacterium]|nr:serine hydrolase [Lentisphaeria bacterium]